VGGNSLGSGTERGNGAGVASSELKGPGSARFGGSGDGPEVREGSAKRSGTGGDKVKGDGGDLEGNAKVGDEKSKGKGKSRGDGDKEDIDTGKTEKIGKSLIAEPAFDLSNLQVSLSEEAKKHEFKRTLRVRVTIQADGSHDEEIVSGSGDDEVDEAVLRALRKKRWRPAVKNGEKVESSRTVTVSISVGD
jgi:TonB family protein